MKKFLKLGLLSVALLTTVVTSASNKLNVKVASSSAKMLSISLTKVVSGETLLIKDAQGEILFSEKLSASEKYTKAFSLSTLPVGIYFIESKETSKVQVTPVVVNSDSVALVSNAAKTYHAPEITVKDGFAHVNVRNYNNENVYVALFDDLGALLNKTEESSNTLVFGTYDISKLNSDMIVVSVTQGDYNFVKEIKL